MQVAGNFRGVVIVGGRQQEEHSFPVGGVSRIWSRVITRLLNILDAVHPTTNHINVILSLRNGPPPPDRPGGPEAGVQRTLPAGGTVITYHVGDATQPDLDGVVTIAHVLSDCREGYFDAGFAKAIAARHPRAQTRFKNWARGDHLLANTARSFQLGAVQWVGVGYDLGRSHRFGDRWVANMVAQHGLRSATNQHPLDLDALSLCLLDVAVEARGPIAMPRLGCGLAGGNWDEVEPVIDAALKANDVHVYDLDPAIGVLSSHRPS
jgi:O-acetyl-ADP-ribose deacetylase (regulator of RNase III)